MEARTKCRVCCSNGSKLAKENAKLKLMLQKLRIWLQDIPFDWLPHDQSIAEDAMDQEDYAGPVEPDPDAAVEPGGGEEALEYEDGESTYALDNNHIEQDSLVNRLVADEEDSIQNGFNDDSEDVEYVESTPLLSSIKPEFPGHSGLVVGLPKAHLVIPTEFMEEISTAERKQISCDLCGKRYVDEKGLQRHISQQHSGQRFQCAICPSHFGTANAQKKHEKEVHSTEPKLTCHLCSKSFAAKRYFDQHCKTPRHIQRIKSRGEFSSYAGFIE